MCTLILFLKMIKSNVITALSLIGLIVLAVIAYQFQAILLSPHGVPRAVMSDDCDLHQSDCTAVFSDGRKATLSLSPKNLPLLKPIQIKVQLEGFDAKDMQFNIIGLNMDMGVNRNTLTPSPQKAFTGTMILPTCSNQRMTWEAQAIITDADDKIVIAPFQFYTDK